MKISNKTSIAVVLALWLPVAAANSKDVSPKSFKIRFDVRRGSARDLLSPIGESRPKFVKRDNEGSFEIELVNEQTFYLADLYIGSNEDKNQVLVDTGSSDLWVMSHDLECYASYYSGRKRDAKNVLHAGTGLKFIDDKVDKSNKKRQLGEKAPEPIKSRNRIPEKRAQSDSARFSYTYLTDYPEASQYPEPTISIPYSDYTYESYNGAATCTSYGTYNTENSDTFSQNDTDPFEISYADGTFALGIWGHDTVRIGNLSVRDLSFAIANESSSDIGVLGIGLPGLEVTQDIGGYSYENLPLKMKSDGVINKALYSLYLDKADADSGSILFGAVDHAKYVETLETLKLRNTYEEYDYPVKFEVAVDNISVDKNGKNTTVLSSTTGAVLDSGSTLSYLRSNQIAAIAEALDGTYSSSSDAYIIDCDYENDRSTTIDITFGNKVIKVPVADLVLESYYGSTCYLGLFRQSSSTTYILFGDNVLRSAYVVYDLEDNEVHIGQAYYTEDEDIEVVDQSVPTTGGQKPTSTDTDSTATGAESGSSSRSTLASRSTVAAESRTTSGSASRSTSASASGSSSGSGSGSETGSSSSATSSSATSSSATSSSTAAGGSSNDGMSLFAKSWTFMVGGLLTAVVIII
ncbi:hypothetical protein CANMA_000590 [Candida margitis]|uniref:uncharacterized protein n=1 Tax=Candida margitis TaxID=1775924 RepID=UPI0022261BF4|nr:uncharacterized protein CANMA_000590 [Candida margitis]KAI5970427.1 hypothetical protein CANMA_000590 [Candida margitis]